MKTAQSSTDILLNQLALTTEALGPAVEAVGSAQFLPTLYEGLVRFVDFDALHLDYDQSSPRGRRVGWIGSFGKNPELIQQTMELYYRSYANDDPTFGEGGYGKEVQLLQVSAQRVDAELRRAFYDIGDIHDECVVGSALQDMTYGMSVCRTRRLPPFSLKELSIVKHLATLVLPLAALHKRLAGAISTDTGTSGIPDSLVAQWLGQSRAKLTSREATVCSAFIQGMTTQAVAVSMGVKPSTVETYAKRAFAKLEIASRRQLLASFVRSVPLREQSLHAN
ncbi:helix-turn-helix transcriptional regulator [Paraburkholderia sp. BL23I1N1]|uniref:helix-turn-helix transcriptional regulator n=1 Tax=Paraburkholderia sp. BL23I1N1 TaxID=1938802 RepID=UPI000E728C58|nr:helix-turn-helix transcriptional regulator [Paraburkholderia sp. BL23I1N1]